jgi:hypothetical protein
MSEKSGIVGIGVVGIMVVGWIEVDEDTGFALDWTIESKRIGFSMKQAKLDWSVSEMPSTGWSMRKRTLPP